jgi:hypothetical protein
MDSTGDGDKLIQVFATPLPHLHAAKSALAPPSPDRWHHSWA